MNRNVECSMFNWARRMKGKGERGKALRDGHLLCPFPFALCPLPFPFCPLPLLLRPPAVTSRQTRNRPLTFDLLARLNEHETDDDGAADPLRADRLPSTRAEAPCGGECVRCRRGPSSHRFAERRTCRLPAGPP